MRGYIFLGVILLPLFAAAQPVPDTLWTRVIGGAGDDVANVIRQTSDGGFIIAGYTSSSGAGSFDMLLVKLDSLGNTEWQRTYGSNYHEYANDVVVLSNNEYAVVGDRGLGSQPQAALWMKINSLGDTILTREFSFLPHMSFQSISTCGDQEFVATGFRLDSFAFNQPYLCRGSLRVFLDWEGNLVRYVAESAGTSQQYGRSSQYLAAENGTGCFFAKYNYSGFELRPRGYAYFNETKLEKRSPSDSLIWWFGISVLDQAYSAITIAEDSTALFSSNDYIMKLRANGSILWYHQFPVTPVRTFPSPRNGLIIASRGIGGIGGSDFLMQGYDSLHALKWSSSFGGQQDEILKSVQRLSDGKFILAGTTHSFGARGQDIYLVKARAGSPPLGYLEVLSSGPERWGYRLHRWGGSLSTLTFSRLCPGTIGSISGNAAQTWTMQQHGDSIIFRLPQATPNFTSVDTFWLSHPTCSGAIHWSVHDSSGTISGPYSAPHPATIGNFTVAVTDSGFWIMFITTSEQHTAAILLQRGTNNIHFQTIWQPPEIHPDGFAYRYFDHDAVGGVPYYYTVADSDRFGYANSHPSLVRTATLQTHRIQSFDAAAYLHGVSIHLRTAFENGTYRVEILRAVTSRQYFNPVAVAQAAGYSQIPRTYEFVDSLLTPAVTYWYYPAITDLAGSRVDYTGLMQSVRYTPGDNSPPGVPDHFSVAVFPNPFNSTTTIRFTLPINDYVTITLHDITGKQVAVLAHDYYQRGAHDLPFQNTELPSGIYFAHVAGDKHDAVQKLVLLR